MSLGESVSSGPFFKAYVANLLPGQFIQPFIDAAFSDLGLDPNVLLPSERTDPQTGQPATPGAAGAVSTHRAGRRSAADAARCDHRQSRRCPVPVPGAAACPATGRSTARPAGRAATGPRISAWTNAVAGLPAGSRGGRMVTAHAQAQGAAGHRPCAGSCRRLRRGGSCSAPPSQQTKVVAYFDNSNGIFDGDDVMHPRRAGRQRSTRSSRSRSGPRSRFWSTTVQGARRRQSGHHVADAGHRTSDPAHPGLHRWARHCATTRVIPQDRTAVPVEFDDFREQLEKLTEALQPTATRRGQHARRFRQHRRRQPARAGRRHSRHADQDCRRRFPALGDHSDDIFSAP